MQEVAGPSGRPVGVLGFGWGGYVALKAAGRGNTAPLEAVEEEAIRVGRRSPLPAPNTILDPAVHQGSAAQQGADSQLAAAPPPWPGPATAPPSPAA